MEIKDIEHILSVLKKNDITEFELQQDGTQFKLKRGVVVETITRPMAADVQPAIIGHSGAGHNAAPAEKKSENDHLFKVESPIVGTFYRRPSPDSEPFVREGDMVKKGATLCIVEAMKLMNEIESPCAGRIEKVLLTDGQVVEFGEILILINPDA